MVESSNKIFSGAKLIPACLGCFDWSQVKLANVAARATHRATLCAAHLASTLLRHQALRGAKVAVLAMTGLAALGGTMLTAAVLRGGRANRCHNILMVAHRSRHSLRAEACREQPRHCQTNEHPSPSSSIPLILHPSLPLCPYGLASLHYTIGLR